MSARGGKKKGAKRRPQEIRLVSADRTAPRASRRFALKCNSHKSTHRVPARETGPRSADWEYDWCGVRFQDAKAVQGPEGTSHALRGDAAGRHGEERPVPAAMNGVETWCPKQLARGAGTRKHGTLCDISRRAATASARARPARARRRSRCRWCDAASTRYRRPGPTGEDELCDSCGDAYAMASAKIKARLDHVEKELVRLTSVLAIDVDAGTETRIPRPKRSSEAPGGGLKALKAATDATAGALVQVKREKEALEDRLLCTICMEADAPRAVVFGPCDHFLACASCADALKECPNCRATITTRTTIANSS